MNANDKKVTYAHKDDPSGYRFIDFARCVPTWAVDVQDYAEETQREMNANELADEWDDPEIHYNQCDEQAWSEKAQAMLRQQQSEIAKLKSEIEALKARTFKHLTKEEMYEALGDSTLPFYITQNVINFVNNCIEKAYKNEQN